jgi:hypothetical protein
MRRARNGKGRLLQMKGILTGTAGAFMEITAMGGALPSHPLAKLLTIMFLLGIPVVAAIAWVWHVRRRRMAKLRGRQRLSAEAFYDEFYSGSGLEPECVKLAIEAVSAWLDVPRGVLRPSDSFSVELAEVRPWLGGLFADTGLSGLQMVLDRMLRKALKGGAAIDASSLSINTLDDFVKAYCLVARATKRKREGLSKW